MSRRWVDAARPWFVQAASDIRVALCLRAAPVGPSETVREEDIACHVAAMCAQAIEKSLKGYVLLNHMEPALTHRSDKYFSILLDGVSLHHSEHHKWLSNLFDSSTRSTIRELLDLTPGGLGARTDLRNTEYPWKEDDRWARAPAMSGFVDDPTRERWLRTAKRVSDVLYGLWIGVDLANPA